MRKTVFGVLFSLISLLGLGQSIPSYWMNVYHQNELYKVIGKNITQMTVDVTGYYLSGGSFDERWIFNYLDSTTISGQKYKEGELSSSFEYKFDSLGNLIQKKTVSKLPAIGWQTTVIVYEYNNNHIKIERQLNSSMQLEKYCQYDYDEFGRPIKLSFFNPEGQLTSYETAEYNKEKQVYIEKIFNSSNELVLNHEVIFNPDTTFNIRNEHNEYTQIKWPGPPPGKNIIHRYEYKYDNFENWIKRKWIIIDGNKENTGSIVKRKIIYSK